MALIIAVVIAFHALALLRKSSPGSAHRQPGPHRMRLQCLGEHAGYRAVCAARDQAKLNKVDGVTATANLSAERAHVTAPPHVSASAPVAMSRVLPGPSPDATRAISIPNVTTVFTMDR